MRRHTGERPFQCHLCGRSFTFRSISLCSMHAIFGVYCKSSGCNCYDFLLWFLARISPCRLKLRWTGNRDLWLSGSISMLQQGVIFIRNALQVDRANFLYILFSSVFLFSFMLLRWMYFFFQAVWDLEKEVLQSAESFMFYFHYSLVFLYVAFKSRWTGNGDLWIWNFVLKSMLVNV